MDNKNDNLNEELEDNIIILNAKEKTWIDIKMKKV